MGHPAEEVIMGTISGAQGYRALEDFVERRQSSLLAVLELPYKRLSAFSKHRCELVSGEWV